MIQILENLDEALDVLGEIDNRSFSFENFNEINSKIEEILIELKSNEQTLNMNKSSENYIKIYNKIFNKIYTLETKILPKANLLDSFSK